MPKTKHKEYGEIRKPVGIALTSTALKGIDAQAKELGISRSELIEQIGRGVIPLANRNAVLGESLTN